MKIDVTISENELKQIVREHLLKKFKNVGEVKIEVGTKSECVDPYRGEYQSYGVFKQVKCNVEA